MNLMKLFIWSSDDPKKNLSATLTSSSPSTFISYLPSIHGCRARHCRQLPLAITPFPCSVPIPHLLPYRDSYPTSSPLSLLATPFGLHCHYWEEGHCHPHRRLPFLFLVPLSQELAALRMQIIARLWEDVLDLVCRTTGGRSDSLVALVQGREARVL